jgi:hypothetical protein
MKLSNEQIEKLSFRIYRNLIRRGLIDLKVEERKFIDKIIEIIFNELKVEDDLNKEVREILKGYEREIDAGNIDYYKMFNLIKSKLVKDRNLIL